MRLSAVGFAIAGNFEDAISAWRTQARSWIDQGQGIVLASGAGALGVRLGGPLPLDVGVDFRPELGDGEGQIGHGGLFEEGVEGDFDPEGVPQGGGDAGG